MNSQFQPGSHHESQRHSHFGPDTARTEYDEYGAELGPDARVWSTYMHEADRCDQERVGMWNKNMDVTLVSAALFSAVLATLVTESTKKLRPEPTEISVYSDRRTAFDAARSYELGVHQRNSHYTLEDLRANQFQKLGPGPSSDVIWINILWYLSLVISLLTCVAAIMAKGWSNAFISGRSGRPFTQARLRQRRLDEIKRWRMEEFLESLPFLMQLSFFLFLIGLDIHLCSTHIMVALPILIITCAVAILYSVATTLSLKHEHSPYKTSLTPLLKLLLPWLLVLSERFYTATFTARLKSVIPQQKGRDIATEQAPILDGLTSRKLNWLITNSQDSRAVDLALQSIAGFSSGLEINLLGTGCDLPTLLVHRFLNCFTDAAPGDGETKLAKPSLAQEAILYGRALGVIMSSSRSAGGVWARDSRINDFPKVLIAYKCLCSRSQDMDIDTRIFALQGLHQWTRGAPVQLDTYGILLSILANLRNQGYADKWGSVHLHPTVIAALDSSLNYFIKSLHTRLRGLMLASHWSWDTGLMREIWGVMEYSDVLARLEDTSIDIITPIARLLVYLPVFRPHLPLSGWSKAWRSLGPILDTGYSYDYDWEIAQYNKEVARGMGDGDANSLLTIGFLGILYDYKRIEIPYTGLRLIGTHLGKTSAFNCSRQLHPASSRSSMLLRQVGSLSTQVLLDFIPYYFSKQTKTIENSIPIIEFLVRHSHLEWGPKSELAYRILAYHSNKPLFEDLRLNASSSLLWRSWRRSIQVPWEQDGNFVLGVVTEHDTFRHIYNTLGAAGVSNNELKPITPFMMCHLWTLTEGMINWMSGLESVPNSHVSVFDALASLLGGEPRATSIHGQVISMHSSGIIQLAEGWITELELLVTSAPHNVFNSGILSVLLENSDIARSHEQRLRSMLKQCAPTDPPAESYTPNARSVPRQCGSSSVSMLTNSPLYLRVLQAKQAE